MNYQKRVRKLQSSLGRLDSFLLTDPGDIFYYSGFWSREEKPLLIVGRGKPVLLLSPLTGSVKVHARVETGWGEFIGNLGKNVGIDELSMPVRLQQELRGKKLKNSSKEIKKPREVKDSQELQLMKDAIRLDKRILEGVRVAGTEAGMASEIELGFLKAGASLAFSTIIASGSNAGRYIHHTPTSRRVSRKETVIVDFGSKVSGYCSDITRTSIDPQNQKQKKLFEQVLDIQSECIDLVSPGVEFEDVNAAYRKRLKKLGYSARHGIGHGIGISVHEPAAGLEPGMVVTIEPGIYLPWGGCRLEDMVLVTKNSRKVLSKPVPVL